MEAEGIVGEVGKAPQGLRTLRLGPYGATWVSDEHGRYFEACRQGRLFVAATVGAGFSIANATFVAPLAATSTPIIGLFNPVNSGKALSILGLSVTYEPTAETAIALPVWVAAAPNCGITATAANVTITSARLDLQTTSVARGFANTALTGLVNAFTTFRSLFGNALHQSSATVAATVSEETAGSILIPPGAFAGVLVAGATPATSSAGGSILYEEVEAAVTSQ